MTCRLLPFLIADGAYNMAADEALLHSAADPGVASLRFYGWSHPTLSLGYFQPERLRHADPLLASLPYVRRPSGGDTLVHHHEATYALALPAGLPWQSRTEPWSRRMHVIIAAALRELGVLTRLHVPVGKQFEGALCFTHFSVDDLLIEKPLAPASGERGWGEGEEPAPSPPTPLPRSGGEGRSSPSAAKIVGSAQRRHRGAILQHGAILLAQSPYTPALPGIRELTGRELSVEEVCRAVRQEFSRHTGWPLAPDAFTEAERQRIATLVAARYTQDVWNRKR